MHERALTRKIRIGNDDLMIQSIGGRANLHTLARYGFNSEEGREYGVFFLEKLKLVEKILATMLGGLVDSLGLRISASSWINSRKPMLAHSSYVGHLKGGEWQ